MNSSQTPPDAPPTGDESESALVLLVDDDARTARRMARMLRDDGFDVEVAVDGAAAIARLTRTPLPRILVTDLRMPHADGVTVARFGRIQRPGLPVFVVTGYPDQMSPRDFGSPPPVLFTKPVDYDHLKDELSRTLASLTQKP